MIILLKSNCYHYKHLLMFEENNNRKHSVKIFPFIGLAHQEKE